LRKALLFLFVILLAIVLGYKGLSPHSDLTDEQRDRLQLVEEIKIFEKKLGFTETDNFKVYSDETEAYDYYFYTPVTALPYSLDDPLLQNGTGTSANASIDLARYDAFFYSIEAIAGVKTPVTRSLLRAPLPRLIHVIFHEDWHEQMNSPLGIEEPCAEVISYTAAMLFTEEKYGRQSEVYQTLKDEFSNKLKVSQIYRQYHEELSLLYARFHSGDIPEDETLSRKAELIKSMGNDLKKVWGAKERQLNNAFIGFQMTYFRYLPFMHQVFTATNFDLQKTMTIFRSVPEQGTDFEGVEELKRIESSVIDYLHDTVPKTGETATGGAEILSLVASPSS